MTVGCLAVKSVGMCAEKLKSIEKGICSRSICLAIAPPSGTCRLHCLCSLYFTHMGLLIGCTVLFIGPYTRLPEVRLYESLQSVNVWS